MSDSSLPTAHEPSSARPPFGGLNTHTLRSNIQNLVTLVGSARIAVDLPGVDKVTLSRAAREDVANALAGIPELVAGLLRDAHREHADDELIADLRRVAVDINKARSLAEVFDAAGPRKALAFTQTLLIAMGEDVRWEVELVQAEMEFAVADQNRAAARSLHPMPVFMPAPALPRDAGSAKLGAILAAVGVAAVVALCVAIGGKADARALDGPPVQAVRVVPAKSHPKCAGIYRVTVPVDVTGRSTADGKFHAAVWLQERYERPRWNKATKRWEYFRARLVGTGVSDTPVVRVSGCIDPAKVDGLGGPIYLILNDVVDDDQDPAGRILRGTVRVVFTAAGWKVSR